MPILITFTAQLALSEQGPQAAGTPIWVPLAIVVLMLLLLVWGLTRGNVLDENLPHIEGAMAGNDQHSEADTH